MTQPYQDLSELALHARRGYDYDVTLIDRGAEVTVVAIHGGYIEPPTEALARAIAGVEYNLYCLTGLLIQGRELLRIPVSRFDDMRLKALLERSAVALSILGAEGGDARVHLGGRNRSLGALLAEALAAAGFATGAPLTPGAAHSPSRFVNRTAQGGVQLELTRALRQSMVRYPLDEAGREQAAGECPPELCTPHFRAFVDVVRQALEAHQRLMRADLDETMRRFEDATGRVLRAIPLHPGPPDQPPAADCHRGCQRTRRT